MDIRRLQERSMSYVSLSGSHICYTYFLGWSKLGLYYYGVRYRKGCHPRDLGVKYRSSSKLVHRIWDSEGNPDLLLVDKVFGTDSKSAILYEKYVLEELDVLNNERFLNRNISGAISIKDSIDGGKKKELMYPDQSFRYNLDLAKSCGSKKELLYPNQSFRNPEFRRKALEAKRLKKLIREGNNSQEEISV